MVFARVFVQKLAASYLLVFKQAIAREKKTRVLSFPVACVENVP